jgi:hypothetical protein
MIAIKTALTGSTSTPQEIIEEGGINLVPKPLFIFMIVPDFLVIIAFLFLFWQLLSLYNTGHANLFKIICTGSGKYLISAAAIMLSFI